MKKVIVCGPYNAGKTTFVRNVNREEFVGTDEPEIDVMTLKEAGTTTTVGVEVSFLRRADKEIMFIGVPGQLKFDFIWEVVGNSFDGILFLIPSFLTLKEAAVYVDFFSRFESFKSAFKSLVVTYPERLSESKIFGFRSFGFPVKVLNPRDESAVKQFALEILESL